MTWVRLIFWLLVAKLLQELTLRCCLVMGYHDGSLFLYVTSNFEITGMRSTGRPILHEGDI